MSCNYVVTKTFTEIFPDENTFINNLPQSYKKYMMDANSELIVPMDILYLLLIAQYGNTHIKGTETSFSNRLYAIIFQYGPTWAKNLDIQDQLRKLDLEKLKEGSTQINNHAYNPSTVIEGGPNPDSGEIETVNEQYKTKYKKNAVDAYTSLIMVLSRDVTQEFINRFRTLFSFTVRIGCDCNEETE